MTKRLLPAIWRDIGHVGGGVMDAFDRWLAPRRREQLDGPFGMAALFGDGGPPVDVVEDDDAVRVTAEVPGLDQKDFTVEVSENQLVIRGEKKAGHEERKRDYYYSECSYGSFSRSIPLPCEVDAGKAKARYKNGVLDITLPKTEEAKSKRIKVAVS